MNENCMDQVEMEIALLLIGKLKRLGGEMSSPLRTAFVSRKVEHQLPYARKGKNGNFWENMGIYGTFPTLRSKM